MTPRRGAEGSRRAFTPGLGVPLLTPAYDVVTALLGFGASFHRRVTDVAAVAPGEAVLDVGCGTGTLLGQLVARQPAARYAGIDPDPVMLTRARSRLPSSVDLRVADAKDLPFEDGAFDVVVSTLVFHHLDDAAKVGAAGEVRRVLVPGGRFLLADFGTPPSRVSGVLLRLGSVVDGRANLRANLAGQVPGVLADAGLVDVREVGKPYRAVRFVTASRPR